MKEKKKRKGNKTSQYNFSEDPEILFNDHEFKSQQ